MTRAAVAQLAFSSGEVSPLLRERIDYQRHQTGLARAPGFIPLRQGGFTRAPGTIMRGETRSNATGRLIPFEFAKNDAVVLELTPGWMRVWRYGAPVLSGGVPYELASPYDADDLERLQWVQSADVIYFADGEKPIQKLSRFALDNWQWAAASFDTGPFRVQNLDEARTIKSSAASGSVTLTASSATFTAAHVGSLMRLEADNYSGIPLWTGNTDIEPGQLMRYDGNIYELITAGGTDGGPVFPGGPVTPGVAGNTGLNPPVHTEGIEMVSLDPVIKWKFVSDGVGVVRITAVASSTSATATVIKRLPPMLIDVPTYRWSEGAWSDVHGYPSALEIYEQRLVAAATPTEPRTLWFSIVGDFQDFTPGNEADEGFAYSIAGNSSMNRILWLKAGRSGLHIGALGEEYSSRSSDGSKVVGPTTTAFGLDSSIGSAGNVRPISPDGRPIFVSKDGRRVIEIGYDFQSDSNRAAELSLPSEHLGADGYLEIAWQSAPQRLAWLRRGTGELAVMLYDPSEDVLGWAPCPLAGGAVEAMAVTSSADGSSDILMMIVRRVIDGETLRFVEEQAIGYGVLGGSQPIAEAVHLFCARIFTPEVPAAEFAVPHLAGETVYAWTDIGEYGPIDVPEGGTVTLPVEVGRATIGLFDATHFVETLPLQPIVRDGSGLGRRKRLTPMAAVGLHRTAAARVATVEYDFAQAPREWPAMNVIPRQVAADLSQAFSGMSRLPLTTGYANDVAVRFYPVGGAPMTVTALEVSIAEAGL